jgi:hypothetical protein
MRTILYSICAALAIGGCTLARAPLVAERDAPTMDAGLDANALDASVVEDGGGGDGAVSDVGGDGGRDTGIDSGLDVGPPDAPTVDTGVDAGSRTCDGRFGALPAYSNCVELSPGVCRFYVDPTGTDSCAAMCGTVPGASCVGVYDDHGMGCAGIRGGVPGGCTRSFDHMVCACTLGS